MKQVFEIVVDNLYRHNEDVYNDQGIQDMAWTIWEELANNDYQVTSWLYNYIDSTWIDLRMLKSIENDIYELFEEMAIF